MMWACKGFVLLVFSFTINNVLCEADSFNYEEFLKDAEVDKESQSLVEDVAHFVVNKVESATQSIGANGVLDPVKLQEFVTSTLAQGTQWLSDKTSTFYEKIKKKVSEWWSSTMPKGAAVARQEEYSEEVARAVVKKILLKIEDELKSKNITGIDQTDIEKWILPVVKKTFGDLFGFPVRSIESS